METRRRLSDAAALRARLEHVYWIGGGSGSGKSTVARRLAAEHGLRLYATDDVMSDHARRTPREEGASLAEFAGMDMDERWLSRSPEAMLESFHWFRGEGFPSIVDDLLGLPGDWPVVAEGFRLLPSLVQPLLAEPTRAVWLLPTPEFRVAALAARGSTWAIARRTSDPPRALRNLLERDRLFTERIREETARLGLRAIEVDATLTEADLSDRVARALGF